MKAEIYTCDILVGKNLTAAHLDQPEEEKDVISL